ncbi:Methyltransferase domain-containing protein [Paenimyroides ummariense]|uniref:Methyltransferase domain-containing protein n=1 Tax=Paenimyroides ummariense TaxID=913024 RepID=A0A1I5FD71_9FLAO|nr:class I SAM-dependent methyltransferase [Paenimyroides ummariense]SFO21695.1 Methyltransferase domain-containing protein [Paenimyroides ummariense]
MKDDLKDLAKQLGNPEGETGIEVANMMNATNIGMTKHTITSLNLDKNDIVLELGHGNCGHLPFLMNQAKNLKYFGLEISELMQQEATKSNQNYIENNSAKFELYNGTEIPFDDAAFDKIFTVNTLYFWKNPDLLLNEIYRVLKPNGIFALTFADKSFMDKLPFTPFGFNLYSLKDAEELLQKNQFKILNSISQTEQVSSKTNEMVNRSFFTVLVKK